MRRLSPFLIIIVIVILIGRGSALPPLIPPILFSPPLFDPIFPAGASPSATLTGHINALDQAIIRLPKLIR